MREHKFIINKSQLVNTVNITLIILRYLLWGALILIAVVIASLNANPVVLHYFWGTVSLPLYLVLLACFMVGWLIGVGINLISHIKLNIVNRQLENRCQATEAKLIQLKKDFIPDEPKDRLSTAYPT